MKQFFTLLSLTLFLLISSISPSASAIDATTLHRYAQNNIMFVNTGTNYSGDACFVDLGDNAKTALNYLMSAGYSPAAAAVLVGIMSRESGLRPNVLEGGQLINDDSWRLLDWDNARHWQGAGGFGLMQWTDKEEHENLQAFADNKGQPVTSLEVQLAFLVRDLACSKEAGCDRNDPNSIHQKNDAYAYFDVESLNKYAARSMEEAAFWLTRRYTIPSFICNDVDGDGVCIRNGRTFNHVPRTYPAGVSAIRSNGGGGYIDSYKQYVDLANELSGSVAQTCSNGGGDNGGGDTGSSPVEGGPVELSDYKVVNSPIPLSTYIAGLRSHGIYQAARNWGHSVVRNGLYGWNDQCYHLALAQANGILHGMYPSTDVAHNPSAGGGWRVRQDLPEREFLDTIYQQINSNHPVVIKVSLHRNKDKQNYFPSTGTKDTRHFITVVGYKKSIASASDLTMNDLLVLDSWNATTTSSGSANSRVIRPASQLRWQKDTGYWLTYQAS